MDDDDNNNGNNNDDDDGSLKPIYIGLLLYRFCNIRSLYVDIYIYS